MTKRFAVLLSILLLTVLASVAAGGFALIRVRAQVATIQPFVAIMVEEVAPRPDQPPTPVTSFQTHCG